MARCLRQLVVRAELRHAAALEHRDEVSAFDGREAVGDDDPGAVLEQPLRRRDHARLRHRIHPRRGLVEDDDLDVACEQTGEGDELRLPRRERDASRAEQGVDAVRQSLDPVAQPELGHDRRHPGIVRLAEERDVLGQRAREDVGLLGHRPHSGAQGVDVELEHITSADEHLARRRLDGPGDEARERRLAGTRAPDERERRTGGKPQVDVLEDDVVPRVGEREVAELEAEIAVGDRIALDALGLDRHELTQSGDGAEAGLQVGKLLGEAPDPPDEGARHEHERHNLRDREVTARGENDTDRHRHGEQEMQRQPGAKDDADFEAQHVLETTVHHRRQAHDVGEDEALAEVGADVVTRGHALFERSGVLCPLGFLDDLPLGDLAQQGLDEPEGPRGEEREHHPRGSPGHARHDPHGHEREDGVEHHPQLHAHEVFHLVGVVVDAVEHFSHGLLRQRREGLVEHGVDEVLAQRAGSPVDDGSPHVSTHRVEHGAAEQEHGQPRDEPALGMFREPPCEERRDRGTHRRDGQRNERDHSGGATQASPVDRSPMGFGSRSGGGGR